MLRWTLFLRKNSTLIPGYNYGFPFLDDSCGIAIDDNYVQPLYKHMVHIRRPTMFFIGIPYDVCAFPLFDLQVGIQENKQEYMLKRTSTLGTT